MTGSIRNFEKLNFTPKLSVFCFSQGQTFKYDRLAHTPRTRDRCPHRVLSSVSESQKTECCSRYSASGHLQKFAADLSLSTPQNSQPCKIFTLLLNSNQNLHNHLKFLLSHSIRKLSCSILIYIINIVY